MKDILNREWWETENSPKFALITIDQQCNFCDQNGGLYIAGNIADDTAGLQTYLDYVRSLKSRLP